MIRLIKPEEVPAQKEKFFAKYPWAQEPQWKGVYVIVDDEGKISAMAELQIRALVATVDGDKPADVVEMCGAMDGLLFTLGHHVYEFQVPKKNKRFRNFIEKRYKLKPVAQLPHSLYLVRRK